MMREKEWKIREWKRTLTVMFGWMDFISDIIFKTLVGSIFYYFREKKRWEFMRLKLMRLKLERKIGNKMIDDKWDVIWRWLK